VRPTLVISCEDLSREDLIVAAISSRVTDKLTETEFLIEREASYFSHKQV